MQRIIILAVALLIDPAITAGAEQFDIESGLATLERRRSRGF